MNIQGNLDSGAQRSDHRDLEVADRVNRISAQAFEEFERAGIALTKVGRALKFDVFGKSAIAAHLVGKPEHALIIDEEAAAAVFITALDIFHSAQHLFHTTQAVANADALGG